MEQFNVGDCVKSRLIPSMIGTIMDINKRFNTATLSIISNNSSENTFTGGFGLFKNSKLGLKLNKNIFKVILSYIKAKNKINFFYKS